MAVTPGNISSVSVVMNLRSTPSAPVDVNGRFSQDWSSGDK
jgi:hypothetical protein